MGKYKIVLNPTAGSGAGARSLPRIESALNAQDIDFDIIKSEYPGHAIELAREAAQTGYEVVVAAGGDGTSNEVINGLMEAKAAGAHGHAMGILSVGCGNDFAHAVNVPLNLELAARVLAEGYKRRIDIGRVFGGLFPQGRYFGNCVGVGFDAIGTIEASKLPRGGGFFSFLVAVLKTVFLYHKAPISTVTYNDHSLTQPSLMISTMNGRRLGGGFWMAPDSEPDDGLFDLCIAHEVSRARIFGLIPHFLRGTQGAQPEITSGRAARITITAIEGALPAQTDGEVLCIDGQRLEIELLPHELTVVCMSKGSVS